MTNLSLQFRTINFCMNCVHVLLMSANLMNPCLKVGMILNEMHC